MLTEERLVELEQMTMEELARDTSVTPEELEELLKREHEKLKTIAKDIVHLKMELKK